MTAKSTPKANESATMVRSGFESDWEWSWLAHIRVTRWDEFEATLMNCGYRDVADKLLVMGLELSVDSETIIDCCEHVVGIFPDFGELPVVRNVAGATIRR